MASVPLGTILQQAQSPDPNLRNQAEHYMNARVEAQYEAFIYELCVEFAGEGKADANRQLAGLYLKNLVTAKDQEILTAKKNKWYACDNALKEQIRVGFVQTLSNPNVLVRRISAQIIAAYGAVDIPKNAWPTLIQTLLQNIFTEGVDIGTKVSSLETLGYLCELMHPDDIDVQISNQILSGIIFGLNMNDPNSKIAGITALYNSLDFNDKNFDVTEERDQIMKSICDTTVYPDEKTREKAFECLAKIADLYYDKLQPYILFIFQLTTNAIKTDKESVGLQAIEFWATVCECEIQIIDERDSDNPPLFLNIIENASPQLVPFLLEAMTKQSDDIEELWNLSLAAAQCLEAVARTIRSKAKDLILPFVIGNIQNISWRLKEASVIAFGALTEGPSQKEFEPVVKEALPFILACFHDRNVQVRESTAYTIGKICELHKNSIPRERLDELLTALLVCFDDVPKVCSQACFAINNLAEACEEDREEKTNVISIFMVQMLHKLFDVASRPGQDNENLRVSAYEAVNAMVRNSAEDMRQIVAAVLKEDLTRLEQTFQNPNHKEKMYMQSMLCGLISECVQKLELALLQPLLDPCMTLLLKVFESRGAAAHEDALMAIGYIASKTEDGFKRYSDSIQIPLLQCLSNSEEYEVCTIAIGTVGDMARALKHDMVPYCDKIFNCLIELLKSGTINKVVKPEVISVFADIALAIEGFFEKYCPVVLDMLKQAGDIQFDPATCNDEMLEYMNTLHVAIFEAYSGILQGLKDAHKQELVLYAVENMAGFTMRAVRCQSPSPSSELLKAAAGLLGDLAQAFGARVLPFLNDGFVRDLLKAANNDSDSDVRETAKWAEGIMNATYRGRR